MKRKEKRVPSPEARRAATPAPSEKPNPLPSLRLFTSAQRPVPPRAFFEENREAMAWLEEKLKFFDIEYDNDLFWLMYEHPAVDEDKTPPDLREHVIRTVKRVWKHRESALLRMFSSSMSAITHVEIQLRSGLPHAGAPPVPIPDALLPYIAGERPIPCRPTEGKRNPTTLKPNPQTQAFARFNDPYPGRDAFKADPEAWAWLKEVLGTANIDPGEALFWICYQAEGWRDCVPLSNDLLERITKAADRVWACRAETGRFLGRALGTVGRGPTRKLREGMANARTYQLEWARLPELVRKHTPCGSAYGNVHSYEIKGNINVQPFMSDGRCVPSRKSPETAHCKEDAL